MPGVGLLTGLTLESVIVGGAVDVPSEPSRGRQAGRQALGPQCGTPPPHHNTTTLHRCSKSGLATFWGKEAWVSGGDVIILGRASGVVLAVIGGAQKAQEL